MVHLISYHVIMSGTSGHVNSRPNKESISICACLMKGIGIGNPNGTMYHSLELDCFPAPETFPRKETVMQLVVHVKELSNLQYLIIAKAIIQWCKSYCLDPLSVRQCMLNQLL